MTDNTEFKNNNKNGANLLLRQSYYYDLPKEMIAQTPSEKRDKSRLLTLDRNTGEIGHRVFSDITEFLRPGDCLVINDTKVIPARIYGKNPKHVGEVETVLIKRVPDLAGEVWECMTRPGKKTRPGDTVDYGSGLKGYIEDVADGGTRIIKFDCEGNFLEKLDEVGLMPLPPYITEKLQDKNRYQTVYAKYDGSAAAPTAGLHFTPELLEEIQNSGVDIARVLLHVGIGTFRPVKEDDITKHEMHTEHIRVTAQAADKINAAKARGGRVIAVGTTSCRTLESAADETGRVVPCEKDTGIFIYPPYKFKVMDGLITNFHLPESTLLMLVCAFGGYDNVMHAYSEAVKNNYRFFSFGDAMLLI